MPNTDVFWLDMIFLLRLDSHLFPIDTTRRSLKTPSDTVGRLSANMLYGRKQGSRGCISSRNYSEDRPLQGDIQLSPWASSRSARCRASGSRRALPRLDKSSRPNPNLTSNLNRRHCQSAC